jgi:pyrophosphatase PpaX
MTTGPIATVLFDLDGTLIDSIDLILASYRHTMVAHGREPRADRFWLTGLGTPLSAQFRRVSDDPDEVAAMVESYLEYNLANHDRLVRPYDGIADAVATLARRGTLGLVTSKAHSGAERGLRLVGLDRYFPVIVGVEDVTRHKPDPEPVRRAIELLAADPATTVFVGDSPHDMAAGRAAGVRTAAALWGPFSRADLEPQAPDAWLARPADLTAL